MIDFLFGAVTVIAIVAVGVIVAAIKTAAKTDKRYDFNECRKTYVIHVTDK